MEEAIFNRKEHWEKIYKTKDLEKVSWYQDDPAPSLDLIFNYTESLMDSIIDIGGGHTFLVDHLLNHHFQDVSLLDISETALQKVEERMNGQADKLHLINHDIVDFKPRKEYQIWHDRAAFHFLKKTSDVQKYVDVASKGIRKGGYLIIGAFSIDGPTKCSGIEITQYSENSLNAKFEQNFNLQEDFRYSHTTPSGSIQDFVFGVFRRK